MAEERDERGAFDYFLESINRLLADPHFRTVLRELDEGRKETLSLLASDPIAFLRYREVQIPQDFRVSLKKTPKDSATHGGGGGGGGGVIIICDCLEVCFLHWCSILCYCKVVESQQAASSLVNRDSFTPEDSHHLDRSSLSFGAIETLVHQGKTVISSEDSAIVKWAINAIKKGRTATLYCKPTVFETIRRWYWTPERADLAGFKPISAEQSARVKSDFKIDIDGYANSLNCPRCGHAYSTYEFIQQGIEEHGEEHVRAAFSLKRAVILQINPVQDIVCRNCRLHILVGVTGGPGSYDYEYRIDLDSGYACCRTTILALAPSRALASRDAVAEQDGSYGSA